MLCENINDESITYNGLIEKLRQRYGSIHNAATYRAELHCFKQQENQSLRQTMIEIKRLGALASPLVPSHALESILSDVFMNSLIDRDLSFRLRLDEPDNLERTFHLASKYQAYQEMRDTEEGRRKPFRCIRGTVEENPEDPIVNKLTYFWEKKEENFKSWQQMMEKRLDSLESHTPNKTHPPPPSR